MYSVYIQFITEVMTLEITINNSRGQPIYDQIYTQIKGHIISGQLQTGEMLPSIRSLAKDLRISVITTKRAYEELEREGFIYTVTGKGCFVAEKNMDLIREDHLKKIEEHMEEIAKLASTCNLSHDDLIEMFKILNIGE